MSKFKLIGLPRERAYLKNHSFDTYISASTALECLKGELGPARLYDMTKIKEEK